VIWRDPYLPKIDIPDDLQHQWFQLGSAKYQLLPAQYEFLSSQEEATCYIGGYGSGKTRVGVIKSALLAMYPNNRGIVGRLAATDLEETSKRDLLDFLHEAKLIKEWPTTKNNKVIVYCIDPVTGENLGYTSEITFVHLDNPKHLRGRHIGWFWIDEASECSPQAFTNLIGRLRLPEFRARYKALLTGNPEGRNYLYDFFFNEELLTSMVCGRPLCRLSPEECNRKLRMKRRGIHATSYQNYFLPPDYVDTMVASFTPEERERYLAGSFDVFMGQAFKEFSHELHVLDVRV
jgi:phage terminase large subunit